MSICRSFGNLLFLTADNLKIRRLIIALCVLLGAGLVSLPVTAQSSQTSPATTADENRIRAEALYKEASALIGKGEESNLRAIPKLEQALTFFRSVDDSENEAKVLFGLGLAYDAIAPSVKGIDYYLKAARLYQRLGNADQQANALANAAGIYIGLGEYQQAITLFDEALPPVRQAENHFLEAVIHLATGTAYLALTVFGKALDCYNDARRASQAAGNLEVEAVILKQIGGLYLDLEEPQKARIYLEQALEIQKRPGFTQHLPATLVNMGTVFSQLGDQDTALTWYQQGYNLFEKSNAISAQSATLAHMANVYFNKGEIQKAIEFDEKRLGLARTSKSKLEEAQVLNNLGVKHTNLRNFAKGEPYLLEAVSVFQSLRLPDAEATVLYTLGEVAFLEGKLEKALTHTTQVLQIIETILKQTQSPSLRLAYAARVDRAFKLQVQILMALHQLHPQAGYDRQAFEWCERGRARGLLNSLIEAQANIYQGVPDQLIDRKKIAQQRLSLEHSRMVKLAARKPSTEELAAVERAVNTATDEVDQVENEIRKASPTYATLTEPSPMTVKEAQSTRLDPTTILLEYSLGHYKSYLWVISHTQITSIELPKQAEIDAASRRLMTTLVSKEGSRPDEINAAANSLAEMVLIPAIPFFQNAKRVIIVPDGSLAYVPFAALPVQINARILPQQATRKPPTVGSSNILLVDRYELNVLPSTTVVSTLLTRQKNRPLPSKTVAIFADPVFSTDDPRLNSGKPVTAIASQPNPPVAQTKIKGQDWLAGNFGNFRRVKGTGEQAEQIARFIPASQRMLAVGFAANKETLFGTNLGQFRILHFATHGRIDTNRPNLSGLVLSLVDENGQERDGYLLAANIVNLKLNADVVVLSACETALGKEIKAEGVVGLVQAFFYAGTPRVVASLWQVSDTATKEVMIRFYRNLILKKLSPTAALRKAQLEMRTRPEYQTPYFWAGFQVYGSW